MSASGLAAGSLFAGEMRGYFAPVDRADGVPAPFDPAVSGRFALDAPPMGWMSVGTVGEFVRLPGADGIAPVLSGAPATVKTQVRSTVEEEVRFVLPGWSRLAVAISSGLQTLNLLKTVDGANPNASGGAAAAAEIVGAGSTATVLQLSSSTAVQAGDVVVVDADYAAAAGYVGSGIAGSFVANAPGVVDPHFARRVSFNVSRVLSVNAGAVTLAQPLPVGVPVTGMKVAVVEGFCDRSGGAFLQEWSALFVLDGVQGDRLLLHYPRMQPVGGAAAETKASLSAGLDRWRPAARMRALPVVDANDGVSAVCFRTYLPAPKRLV